MKITNPIDIQYDPEVDVIYITLKKGKVFGTQREGLSVIDYDKEGDIFGIEILNCTGKDFSPAKKEGAVSVAPAQ